MITICFTGHRPNKLGGYDWNTPKNLAIIKALKDAIMEVFNNSEDKDFKFIFGGALGIDQMSFEIVSTIIKPYVENREGKIILELAIPFKDQPNNWHNELDINTYNSQLKEADIVTYVDTLDNYKIKGYEEGRYYPAKMQKRNEYIVDKSNIIIAVLDGSKGGTYNCVQYTKKQNKKIIIINPREV